MGNRFMRGLTWGSIFRGNLWKEIFTTEAQRAQGGKDEGK